MRRRALLGLLAVALLLAACANKPAAERVAARARGDGGPAAASRVVSLSPSTTEAMFAIGAGALLVGRSRYCDYPPEATKLPQVGGYVDPSLEAILALGPDLVTGARGPAGSAITERLEARGVAAYFPETESFAAIEAMMLGLGERTGHAEDARGAVGRLRERARAIDGAVAGRARPRVLLVFGLSPLVVAGPSSFADEMIRRAGGANVVTTGRGYPTLDVERALSLDPDVVIDAAMAEHGHARLGADSPGWARARAIAQGRVVPLTDESVIRPGPRVADGLATLARAIHPEAAVP